MSVSQSLLSRCSAMFAAMALGFVGVFAAGGAGAQAIDCAKPGCEARLSTACLSRVGAGSLPKGDACAAEQDAYVACLTAVAEQCGARTQAAPEAGCAPEDARQMFDAVKGSGDPTEFDAFAEACPNAPQAKLARLRAKALRAKAQPSARNSGAAPSGARFAGEWGHPRLVSRTNKRLACTAVLRIWRLSGGGAAPWRYGWRLAHANTLGGAIDASGRLRGGQMTFSNGVRFTLGGGGMMMEAPGIVCAYRKLF